MKTTTSTSLQRTHRPCVYGVDRTDYTMRLLYLPDSMATACGWGGLAYIGCSYWYCTAWIIQPYDEIVAHELRHSAGIFFRHTRRLFAFNAFDWAHEILPKLTRVSLGVQGFD